MQKLEPNVPTGIYFRGFQGKYQKYPSWRYHKLLSPVLVHDTAEDEEALGNGFEKVWAPVTANKDISNWYWDLEDLSRKQLIVYAQDEFGIDFPEDARHEKIFKAILELIRWAPNNRGRLVLMAHTIKLNYDETIIEIKKMAEGHYDSFTDHSRQEVFL